MKRAALVIVMVVFLLAGVGTGFAQTRDLSVDLFGGLGTEPDDEFGTGYGFGLGLNVPFNTIFNVSSPSSLTNNLMIRTDLSYFYWEEDISTPAGSVEVEYTRIPVFLGARYFLLSDMIKVQGLGIYGEIGMELSFDESEAAVVDPFGNLVKVSDDEVNFGIPIGAGIQYYVSERVSIGLGGRLHLISDNYFSLVGSIGLEL